jgi:hypothetical protein
MKDVRFIWGLPQEDSFMKLKELVTSAPVLVLPNDDLPFRLEADGSGIATGAGGPRVMGYSCSAVRSISPVTET